MKRNFFRVFYIDKPGEPVKYIEYFGFPWQSINDFHKAGIKYMLYQFKNDKWQSESRPWVKEVVEIRQAMERYGIQLVEREEFEWEVVE